MSSLDFILKQIEKLQSSFIKLEGLPESFVRLELTMNGLKSKQTEFERSNSNFVDKLESKMRSIEKKHKEPTIE